MLSSSNDPNRFTGMKQAKLSQYIPAVRFSINIEMTPVFENEMFSKEPTCSSPRKIRNWHNCHMLFPQHDCEICQCNHIVIVHMVLTVLYYLYTVGICLLSDVLISTLCV